MCHAVFLSFALQAACTAPSSSPWPTTQSPRFGLITVITVATVITRGRQLRSP